MRNNRKERICVVGLGYVGLTLAASLARKGFKIWGYDIDAKKVSAIQDFKPPFYEPGVIEVLNSCLGKNLEVSASYPVQEFDVIFFAVSTPVDVTTQKPRLDCLQNAIRQVAQNLTGDPIVIIRSTVPAGTTEHMLLPMLRAVKPDVSVAFAPERTIQGQALREIEELPQVVGGVDAKSCDRAVEFFSKFVRKVVPVSSARTAEFVKLINNAHTDVIYSFGNEVALLSEALKIDPMEAIRAANIDYPRPDLHHPGYVGGGCLTKDPYILAVSNPQVQPRLVLAARALNESLPGYTAKRVVQGLRQVGMSSENAKVVVCGITYKGAPATDDLRGTQSIEVIDGLKRVGVRVFGHDPLVSPTRIAEMGAESISSPMAIDCVQAYVFLTNHPEYRAIQVGHLASRMARPAILFDAWRLFPRRDIEMKGIVYQSIGV